MPLFTKPTPQQHECANVNVDVNVGINHQTSQCISQHEFRALLHHPDWQIRQTHTLQDVQQYIHRLPDDDKHSELLDYVTVESGVVTITSQLRSADYGAITIVFLARYSKSDGFTDTIEITPLPDSQAVRVEGVTVVDSTSKVVSNVILFDSVFLHRLDTGNPFISINKHLI